MRTLVECNSYRSGLIVGTIHVVDEACGRCRGQDECAYISDATTDVRVTGQMAIDVAAEALRTDALAAVGGRKGQMEGRRSGALACAARRAASHLEGVPPGHADGRVADARD